jgi:murein DD-endopeptidase MepM/ murein hydrolase activator NlpD
MSDWLMRLAWLAVLGLALLLAGCQAVGTPPAAPTAAPVATPCPTADGEICLVGESAGAPSSGIGRQPTAAGPGVGPALAEPVPTQVETLPTLEGVEATPASEVFTTLIFTRPIAPAGNDQVDASYRFGSTQGKQRDPHHGVEFLNPFGTPVLAAGDGKVVVAGDDKTTRLSPYFNFYGNLVVVAHTALTLPGGEGAPQPVYTLYAHLSEVLVEVGETVRQGELIGKVGMTGGATGSHLHFEVRLGENSYAASRNPELWLAPGLDENGQLNGALAAQVINPQGQAVAVEQVVVEHLVDGPGSTSDWEIYLQSYEENALLGNAPWGESFAAGNLPAGWYRISFPYFGLQRQEVEVLPGQVRLVEFKVQ